MCGFYNMEKKMRNVVALSGEFIKAQMGVYYTDTKVVDYEPWSINELRFLYGVISKVDPLDKGLQEKTNDIKILQDKIRSTYIEQAGLPAQQLEGMVRDLKTQIINYQKEPIVIPKSEYVEFIKDTKSNRKNETLHELAYKMNSKIIDIDKTLRGYHSHGFTFTSIFHDSSYSEDSEELTVYISNAIYPHIVDLKRFVSMAINKTVTISSTKAARLYALCKWNYFNLDSAGETSFDITLDELHKILCKPDTYLQNKSFNQYVLSVSIKAINKNKKLEFLIRSKRYKKVINKKEMAMYKITLTERKNVAEKKEKVNEAVNNLPLIDVIINNQNINVTAKTVQSHIKKYGESYVKDKYDFFCWSYANGKVNTETSTGFYISSLIMDWNTDAMQSDKEKNDPVNIKINALKLEFHDAKIKYNNAINDIGKDTALLDESLNMEFEKEAENQFHRQQKIASELLELGINPEEIK
jgi:menaquinone-dependent protoporphyrinogen IX oxidase